MAIIPWSWVFPALPAESQFGFVPGLSLHERKPFGQKVHDALVGDANFFRLSLHAAGAAVWSAGEALKRILIEATGKHLIGNSLGPSQNRNA